jgi:hypothetical protein
VRQPEPGVEGGPCYGTGTCNDDLECVAGCCERAGGGAGDGGTADADPGQVDGSCTEGARLCRAGDVQACVGGEWTVAEECGELVCDDAECVTEPGDCSTTCGVGNACDGQDCGDGGSCYFGTCLEASDCFLDEGWCTNAFNITPGFVGCSSTTLGVDSRSTRDYCSDGGDRTDIGELAPEQVWGYLPQEGGMRTVTVIPLSDWDVGLYVTSGHCLPSIQCFAEIDAGAPGEPEVLTFYAGVQNSFAIFVDGVRDGTVGGGSFSGEYVISME